MNLYFALMNKEDLLAYLDTYLDIPNIADYGPQGLQVEADKINIKRIALAVDTSPATIQAAASWQADILLVHHGIFWGGAERIVGPFGRRIKMLIQNDIHLYAAHLSLDAHPEVGNNAVLAKLFGVTVESWWGDAKGTQIGVLGSLAEPIEVGALQTAVNTQLATTSQLLAHGPAKVQKIAIISGFGAGKIAEAKALGADLFLTGETSHSHYWGAEDYGLNVLYAGHYATETVGVKALGEHLSQRFDIETKFFDFPTRM